MRNILHMIILTMAIVIAGCTKHKDMEFEQVDNSGYTLIEANVETLIFDSEERIWPEDACIGVYGSEQGENERYAIKNAGEGLKTATFYGPLVKGKIAAYYPYSPSYIGNADGMPVSIDAEQKYNQEYDVLNQFLSYTQRAYGYMQDNKVNFVYPTGILHITAEIIETILIKKITVSSETSMLAGLGIFRNDGTMVMTETGKQQIVLDCGDGVLSKNNDEFTDFYMVLAPGSYEDLKIQFEIDGEPLFRCKMPPIEVKRVSASDFSISTVTITTSEGPAGFTETPVEFEFE